MFYVAKYMVGIPFFTDKQRLHKISSKIYLFILILILARNKSKKVDILQKEEECI